MWLEVNKPAVLAPGLHNNPYNIMRTKKPNNIHTRMVTHHNHHTRAADGVSRGFNGHLARASFNHEASEYNKLPATLRKEVSYPAFKRKLKTWVLRNISI